MLAETSACTLLKICQGLVYTEPALSGFTIQALAVKMHKCLALSAFCSLVPRPHPSCAFCCLYTIFFPHWFPKQKQPTNQTNKTNIQTMKQTKNKQENNHKRKPGSLVIFKSLVGPETGK